LIPAVDNNQQNFTHHQFFFTKMGETKQTQKQTKKELDDKLRLSTPSREVLEELAVACAKDPSPDNTFQYAFALSKSSEKSELRYAVTILDGLIKEGYEHQVDCIYAAATALCLLEDYKECRVRSFHIYSIRLECFCIVVAK